MHVLVLFISFNDVCILLGQRSQTVSGRLWKHHSCSQCQGEETFNLSVTVKALA